MFSSVMFCMILSYFIFSSVWSYYKQYGIKKKDKYTYIKHNKTDQILKQHKTQQYRIKLYESNQYDNDSQTNNKKHINHNNPKQNNITQQNIYVLHNMK